jgi:DNA-binding NarL/FixJ family response regulator
MEAINSLCIAPITPKEYEVLTDLCEGLTNQQLSEKHHISINTIKTHVKQILIKMDVPNRTSVIRKVFG